MQILLANAKIMYEKAGRKPISTPLFQSIADTLANEMAQMDVEELARQLDCNAQLAAINRKRYQNFHIAEKMPAILAYNGQAYKHLRAHTLNEDISGLPASSMACSGPWMASYPIGWNTA